MIYLLYGTNTSFLSKYIKKVLTENDLTELDTTKYDLENTNLTEILDDASTMSLFNDLKAIVVDNAYIFTGITSKLEQPLNLLEDYLNNPNPNVILIFTVNHEKLDERKKIVKKIKKDYKVEMFNKIDNISNYVTEILGEYKMSNKDINLFINRVGDNLGIIDNEIEKMKTYKDNDLTITENDILSLTEKSIDTDIFKLIDNIINKNINEAITSYREMLKYNEEPIKIIIMLSNKIRMMYQAKTLSNKGYSKKDIDEIIGGHPYAIQLALNNSRNYKASDLLKYIEALADLDYEIKSGKSNKDIALELFLINM